MKLDESNFILFAAKYYENTQCFDDGEFFEDLNKIKYIKRLLRKYHETGDIKERLILNHIIVLNNVFGPHATPRLLFLKLEGYESYIKPFLLFLHIMPNTIDSIGYNGRTINSVDIEPDAHIVEKLSKI